MQAMILAAGMGRRMMPLTERVTKAMLRVNGVTLIERMLACLDKLYLSRIVLVVGYQADTLKDFVATLGISTPVEYVHNDVYDKTNNIYSLYLARHVLMEDDTILMESDLIFDEAVLTRLVEHPYPSLAMVAKFENWMDGTVVQLDEDDTIRSFLSKDEFVFDDIPSYYKTVNVYKFSRHFSETHYVPFLRAYCSALGNNMYYEQVLKVIALLDKPEIKALRLCGESWYEIDDLQDLDIAESIFATPEEKYKKFQSRYGGYWRYPNVLDSHYLVNPYFPPPRLVDELKANFERLLGQYPSGLGVNSLLSAKFFDLPPDKVITGNGAAELIKSSLELWPGKLGVVVPTFEEYPNRRASEDLVVMQAPGPDFSYTADDLMAFFEDKDIALLAVVNPDNPSGNFIEKPDLLRLAVWAGKKKIKLIIDESFVDFAEGTGSHCLLEDEILAAYPHLLVVRSISKTFGVPGLRLGLAASGDTDFIQKMRKDVAIWNINAFAEFFLQIFEKYKSDYQEALQKFFATRRRFVAQLEAIPGLRVLPSHANFVMCEVPPPLTARQLAVKLLDEHNILIRDLADKRGFANEQWCRVAVKNDEENAVLAAALKEILEQDIH